MISHNLTTATIRATLMRNSCIFCAIAAIERAWKWITVLDCWSSTQWWTWNDEIVQNLPIARERQRRRRRRQRKKLPAFRQWREKGKTKRKTDYTWIKTIVWETVTAARRLATARARQPKVIVSVLRRNLPLFSVSIVHRKRMDVRPPVRLHLSHRTMSKCCGAAVFINVGIIVRMRWFGTSASAHCGTPQASINIRQSEKTNTVRHIQWMVRCDCRRGRYTPIDGLPRYCVSAIQPGPAKVKRDWNARHTKSFVRI